MNAPPPIITDELAERVDRLLNDIAKGKRPAVQAFALRAREIGVGLVDPDRHRCLIDETIYAGALFRARRWQELAEKRAPVPMILFCPRCGGRHIDKPDPARDWINPPHRTHYCGFCEFHWRPADIATVGVDTLETRGRLDGTLPTVAGVIARGALEDAIRCVIQDACELPDRTSPEDQPEMLLITGDELDMLMRRHFGLEDGK
jgi:hypothetical protein